MIVVYFPAFDMRATVSGYEWQCENKHLEKYLNTMRDDFGTSPSQPDPNLDLANEAISRLRGEIIKHSAPVQKEGVVF
jgi:hypothetical protein